MMHLKYCRSAVIVHLGVSRGLCTTNIPKRQSKGLRTFLTAGTPLLLFLIGGSLFLSQFMDTHMELKDKHTKSTSERKFNLEEENKKLLKQLDIENFSLSRIPRPDDDTKDRGGSKAKK
eukprot:gene25643-34215_t